MVIPKNDDYLDAMVNCIQALSVPEYIDPVKMVNPPLAAVRIADQIFCKGVMTNASIDYRLPLVETKNGKKYAVVSLNFTIVETEAYTASYIAKHGSFRGLSSSLERKIAALNGTQKAISVTDIARNQTIYNG